MADNSYANKRIAKNSIFLSIRMVIVLCINLYTTRAVLALLGVEDYGIYNVVCGFVSMFTFLNTSMSNGIQRFFNFELGKNDKEGANKVFCMALVIQIILAFVIIFLCESFGLWYLHNKMVIPQDRMFVAECIFQLSMVSFLFVIIQAPYTAAVMAHERMDFYAIINIVDAILKLGVVFLVPYLVIDNLLCYGILLSFITVLDFIWYNWYCTRNFSEIRIRKAFHKDLFQSMIVFSGWNLFGSFSSMMREQGVNMIMNLFFGPVVNAARGVAAQINAGISGFVQNILTPVRPQVIQSYAKGEVERSLNLTYSISKFSMIFFYMLCLPVCMEIDYILRLWLGNNVPEHTNSFSIIVLITTAVLILMGAQATLVHASGKMRNYQVMGSVVKFLSVPLAYFLLKQGTIPEIALLMVLLFDIIGLFVGMYIIKGLMPFSIWDYFKKVLLPLVPIMIPPFICVSLLQSYMNDGVIRLLLTMLLSMIFVCSLTVSFGLNKVEKNIINQMLKKIKIK